MPQNRLAQGPGATMTCSPTAIRALVGLDGGDAVVGAELEAGHLGVRVDLDALLEALVAQAHHRLDVEGEAALVLVEADRDALRAPVGEELLHVRVDLGLAEVEVGAVADPLVALEDRGEVALLHLRAERDVADAVVVVGRRVGLPHLDARLHQLAHRRLEVVVADDAAGDAGGACARGRLLDHGDVGAGAEAALPELDGEVVGGREAVHAGADDDEAGRSRYHLNCLPGNGMSKSDRRSVPWPAPVNQPSVTSPPSSGRSPCSTRSPDGGELGTNEIARRTGINASTVSRLLATLAAARFVEHVPETGRYRLSLRLVELGNAVLGRLDLRELARPHLQALVARDRRDGDALGARRARCDHGRLRPQLVRRPERRAARAAERRPRDGGRQGDARVRRGRAAGAGRSPPSRRTRSRRERLAEELDAGQAARLRRGREEREHGLAAVAAPVHDSSGELAGIVGVQGPALPVRRRRRRERAAAVLLGHAAACRPRSAGS